MIYRFNYLLYSNLLNEKGNLGITTFWKQDETNCINPKGIWNKNELKNKTAGEPLFRDEIITVHSNAWQSPVIKP
jgi:hypothetical protein